MTEPVRSPLFRQYPRPKGTTGLTPEGMRAMEKMTPAELRALFGTNNQKRINRDSRAKGGKKGTSDG